MNVAHTHTHSHTNPLLRHPGGQAGWGAHSVLLWIQISVQPLCLYCGTKVHQHQNNFVFFSKTLCDQVCQNDSIKIKMMTEVETKAGELNPVWRKQAKNEAYLMLNFSLIGLLSSCNSKQTNHSYCSIQTHSEVGETLNCLFFMMMFNAIILAEGSISVLA